MAIFNVRGQKMNQINDITNSNIDVNTWDKGLYFIQINMNDRFYVQKLIIE